MERPLPAAGIGLTWEQLTGDLSEATCSSARVNLLEFRRRAEMLQKVLIEGRFPRPLWHGRIEIQALAGIIPADAAALADYHAVRFVAPGWQWVDPAKEVAADVAGIEAGLKSREEVVAARGRDIDELDAERARDREAQAWPFTSETFHRNRSRWILKAAPWKRSYRPGQT